MSPKINLRIIRWLINDKTGIVYNNNVRHTISRVIQDVLTNQVPPSFFHLLYERYIQRVVK